MCNRRIEIILELFEVKIREKIVQVSFLVPFRRGGLGTLYAKYLKKCKFCHFLEYCFSFQNVARVRIWQFFSKCSILSSMCPNVACEVCKNIYWLHVTHFEGLGWLYTSFWTDLAQENRSFVELFKLENFENFPNFQNSTSKTDFHMKLQAYFLWRVWAFKWCLRYVNTSTDFILFILDV